MNTTMSKIEERQARHISVKIRKELTEISEKTGEPNSFQIEQISYKASILAMDYSGDRFGLVVLINNSWGWPVGIWRYMFFQKKFSGVSKDGLKRCPHDTACSVAILGNYYEDDEYVLLYGNYDHLKHRYT